MASVRRAYVDGPHGQMHLRRAVPPGDGRRDAQGNTPLLCIHMSPMTGRTFEALLADLGDDRDAIAFDTPGFGQSDAPAAPPTIADYARALDAGLTALGVTGPVDVLGYHTGSMVGVEMAALMPQRVRRLTMISAPVLTDEERRQFSAYYHGLTITADGAHLVARWKSFLYHHTRPGTTVEDIAEKFPDLLVAGRKGEWGHQAAFSHDLAGRMPAVTQPVLILNTGDDLDVHTRRAAGLAPNSRILEVPGWGHGFLDLNTGDAAAVLRAFLDAEGEAPQSQVTAPASALGPRYPRQVGPFAPR
ncbi:alpha/beta fold hydrolase [Nitrospirillum iridis]|uniref:Pimeloyl-ACP methyl ester carboxylesterase n=1 Tax=Nitrospirillum iridis TaxID=765888 RepID=A0A7X0B1D3_9PROT|nr:alpha/beta fold hydrolase [Nitrospirillum iridis]MBB6253983.1 pimeloyl-ACP methyl ester carboxylesterase [Nitrospirillum iridis]